MHFDLDLRAYAIWMSLKVVANLEMQCKVGTTPLGGIVHMLECTCLRYSVLPRGAVPRLDRKFYKCNGEVSVQVDLASNRP